jgi:hypothetical protein
MNSTYQKDVFIEQLSKIVVTRHDGVESRDVDSITLNAQRVLLEQCFGNAGTLSIKCD